MKFHGISFALSLALLLHITILFLGIITLSKSKSHVKLPIVSAWLVSPLTDNSFHSLHPIKTMTQFHRHQSNTHPIETHHQHSFTNSSLLQRLHVAIAERQVYPEDAINKHQSGKVTIKLLVYPSGRIENATIIRSSGVATIDIAALDAVRALTSIGDIKGYLNTPRYFSVDIEFEL